MPKVCKDGRIWGQNNKEAGSHLGILRSKSHSYKRKLTLKENSERWNSYGLKTRYRKGQIAWNKGKKYPQITGEKHPNWLGGISRE
ncbi:unnamed protein product, partial [marine sediment metagenome]